LAVFKDSVICYHKS